MAELEITSEWCARVAGDLKEGAERLGVKLQPHYVLSQMIKEAEWLATLRPNLFEGLSSLPPEDGARAHVAMVRMQQAGALAETLAVAPEIGNYKRMRPWLKGAIDRLALDKRQAGSANQHALDHLVELEVAGRFLRAGFGVSLDEPDVILHLPGEELGRVVIACKRPKSKRGIHDAMRKGASQIRKSNSPGVIIVNAEPIFHAPEKPGGNLRICRAQSHEQGVAEGLRILSEVATTCEREIESYARKGASVALVVCAGAFLYAIEGFGYSCSLLANAVVHSNLPNREAIAGVSTHVMTGQPLDSISPPGV